MDKNQKVSLGCGTLILIALIVLMFSNPGGGELEQEIKNLRTEINLVNNRMRQLELQIQQLDSKIDKLTNTIEQKNYQKQK